MHKHPIHTMQSRIPNAVSFTLNTTIMKQYYTKPEWPQVLRYNTLLLFLAFLISSFSNVAQAQFGCTNLIYQVSTQNLASGPTTMYSINPVTGTATFLTNMDNISVNGVGYNSVDGYLWGIDIATSRIVKIGPSGLAGIYTIPHLPVIGGSGPAATGSNYYAGDVLPGGYLLINYSGSLSIGQYYVVDINPARTATYLQLVDPRNGYVLDTAPYGNQWINNGVADVGVQFKENILDFAYDAVAGQLIGVVTTIFNKNGTSTFNPTLFRANPVTGIVTGTPISGLTSEPGAIGSVFQDSDQTRIIIGANATGHLYTINKTTGVATLVGNANGLQGAFTDGASCPSATLVPPVCTTPATPILAAGSTSCGATTGTFNITNYNAAYTYTFSPATASVNSSGVVTGTAGTTYTVTAKSGDCTSASTSQGVSAASASQFIDTQPTDQTSCNNGTVTFSATASGTNLSYQWQQYNGTWGNLPADGNVAPYFTVSGTHTNTLTFTPGSANDVTQFRLVVTSSCGSVTSNAALLNVGASPTVSVPAPQTVCPGGTAIFTATPSGAGPFTYQWQQYNGTWGNFPADGNVAPYFTVSGTQTNTLTITPGTGNDVTQVRLIVTNSCGSVTSDAAALTVNPAPTVSAPAPQSVCAGTTASFTVTPTGTGPFTYQWQSSTDGGSSFNNVSADGNYTPTYGNESGSTTATYQISSITTVYNNRQYRVIVSSNGCSTISGASTVTVTTCVPDLTPVIYALPATQYGTTNFTVVVDVYDLLTTPSSGTVVVYLTKDPLVALSFNPGSVLVGGKLVQNSIWTFDASNSGYYTFTTSTVIPGEGHKSFGLTGVLTPGNTQGTLTISTTIYPHSGGEVRIDNNVDADKIDYFKK